MGPDTPAFDAYVAGVDPTVAPLAVDLDRAIRAAHPDFDVAVKYGLLMYAIGSDWRHWVVAIDARPKRVSLKFLFGVLLGDPLQVLRSGTSVLMSWDIAPGAPIDADAVGAYVREAVARYPEYRANDSAVLAAARDAAAARGTRRAGAR